LGKGPYPNNGTILRSLRSASAEKSAANNSNFSANAEKCVSKADQELAEEQERTRQWIVATRNLAQLINLS
jgi:hypothetical protein